MARTVVLRGTKTLKSYLVEGNADAQVATSGEESSNTLLFTACPSAGEIYLKKKTQVLPLLLGLDFYPILMSEGSHLPSFFPSLSIKSTLNPTLLFSVYFKVGEVLFYSGNFPVGSYRAITFWTHGLILTTSLTQIDLFSNKRMFLITFA